MDPFEPIRTHLNPLEPISTGAFAILPRFLWMQMALQFFHVFCGFKWVQVAARDDRDERHERHERDDRDERHERAITEMREMRAMRDDT